MGASCHFLGKITFVLSLAEGLHGGVEIIVRLAVGGGALEAILHLTGALR